MGSAPDAMVLWANYAAFQPGKVIHIDKVQSRMLLWCKRGKGRVTVNGAAFPIHPGAFLFIPWDHGIHYQADSADPFLLAGIHMVPAMEPGRAFSYQIFHQPRPELEEYRCRRDVDIPEFREVYAGWFDERSALYLLAEYVVNWFQSPPREECLARALAQALLRELLAAKERLASNDGRVPAGLKAAMEHLMSNLDADAAVLERVAGCARSTLFRMFKKHLGCTPGEWTLRQRMGRAAELLLQTNLPVGEVGRRVGIEDPYYFSKLFKKSVGMAARDYRGHHSLLGADVRRPV